jgi:hypothetical protein
MGVAINTAPSGGEYVTAAERLYLTGDGERLVGHGDPAARSLFCTPGKRVPLDQARRFGLIPGPELAEDRQGPEAELAVEPPAEKKPATRTRRK